MLTVVTLIGIKPSDIMLNVMQSVAMLNVILLSVIMLSVIMLSVIMLSVIILRLIAPSSIMLTVQST